jgi:transcriptional regulator with XRE-family HTH domain/tetratricopeptide (TPR) repeat protein
VADVDSEQAAHEQAPEEAAPEQPARQRPAHQPQAPERPAHEQSTPEPPAAEPPASGEPAEFGELLIRHRRAVGLTQEALAGRAGMSVRALSNLERGRVRTAQRRSAESLADALGLAGADRVRFLAVTGAVRRRTRPDVPVVVTPPSAALCAPPAMVPDLVGRLRELERLRSWVAEAATAPSGAVVSIVGPPGVGKTTLAVAVAHLLGEEFTDGTLAVDLRGMDEHPMAPGAALDRMLRALGLTAAQIPHSVTEQSNLFRSMLSGRRTLVLLDNANDEAQVRPLLATGRGCVTVITCRRALSGLEGARWLWLQPLSTSHATELLARIADPDQVRAEPDAVTELVGLCGNLPLAVRIAGNRLARQPQWRISALTAQLRDERTRLTALTAGDLRVRPAFAVSYQRLSPAGRFLFRRLALVPGADFDVPLAATVSGTHEADARGRMDELVDATLVQTAARSGRYQFHDLIRIFAGEQLEAEETAEERARAETAVDDHLLRTATAAGRMIDPGAAEDAATGTDLATREAAADWLEREASNWLAAIRHAAAGGRHTELVALARAMHWYSDTHQQHPWEEVFSLAVTSARALGDRHQEAALLNFLGWARYYCLGDVAAGLLAHQEALATAVDVGDRVEQAWALVYLSSVLTRLGRLTEALAHNERATVLFTEFDNWPALNAARNTRGRILRAQGRYDEAVQSHRAALGELRRRADQMEHGAERDYRAYGLSLLGEALLDAQDWSEAAATFRRVRSLVPARERPTEAGTAALHEGTARRRAGDVTTAAECLRYALTLFTDVTARWWRARVLAELAAVLDATDSADAPDAPDTARDHRAEALSLCEELDTEEARTLAAQLAATLAAQPHVAAGSSGRN